MEDFPGDLAAALVHLTHLSLANNRFTRLPSSLPQVPSLEFINISGNESLVLKMEDLEIVRAMPNLITFCVMGDVEGKFGNESVATLLRLKEQFPNLEII